jgi:hypothetical protein
MLVKFEIPTIAPDVIVRVSNLTKEADVKFKDSDERHKKQWVREQAMPLLKDVKLKKIPPWLVKPIKEAAVSIMVDTIWAMRQGEP